MLSEAGDLHAGVGGCICPGFRDGRKRLRASPTCPTCGSREIRLSNWLTREQARELLQVPDRSTLGGKRDYVILALLVGCALRRQELASLNVQTIQMREGRWVLSDMEGKGRRVRTVAISVWVKQGINV